jgi:hypothetical protein
MNRQDRRKQPKPNGKNLWDRLSEQEKDVLSKFMIKEANKELEVNIKNTWDDLEKSVFQAMRNNKISEERVERIFADANKITDRKHGIKVIDENILDKYIVLTKDEFSDLLEYAAMNCENCAGIENCRLMKIQHEQNAPVLDSSFNCKFSYILHRRVK